MGSVQDNWSANFHARRLSRTSKPITIIDVYLGSQSSVDSDTIFFNDSNYNFQFWPYRDMVTKQSYVALGLDRGVITKSTDSQIESLNVVLDNVSRTFSTLFTQQDFVGKRIVIREVYGDLLTASGDFDLLFDGVLESPEMSLEEGVKIKARPSISDSLNCMIPRELHHPCCQNRFTQTECANEGMSAATLLAAQTSQTIDQVISQIEFVDAARTEGSTYFVPGIITMTGGTAANVGEQRSVVAVSGDHIFIDCQFPANVVAGDSYSIERDCDKTFEECKDKFANQANFRGDRYLPITLLK